ncbi:decaprenyl-phosphate phosphoribosyltransferase [Clostridium massiliamazoniense]|uniref:decaprenyl-phosphate phosphoribosyltransferase n=1 Tax=Clostridium massiliamazoniense TaxID=1347366 RepID=UPI000A7FEEEF|nr:decaprenyl-phosphate phosphoribosyltransferase [Clostridium massiliamazoniense]
MSLDLKERNEAQQGDPMKRGFFFNLLKLMRPKQWIKNLFVFAPLLFSYSFAQEGKIEKSIITFILFCLTSSTVYIMNDILDVESDRVHPKKRFRPIASGAIKVPQAIGALIVLLLISLIGSYFVNRDLFIVIVLYLINNLLYSFKIKHIVIVDIVSIAIGFILRITAGGIVIDVKLSGWIILCTFFISLFLGFEKRKNELVKLSDKATEHRKILEDYSEDLLIQYSNISVTCTLVCYAIYTFVAYPANNYMMFTNIFVVYGLFRYKYLAEKKGTGGSPTEAVLTDKTIMIDVLLWIISSAVIIIYFNK